MFIDSNRKKSLIHFSIIILLIIPIISIVGSPQFNNNPLDNNQFEFDNIRSSIKELELGITSNSEKKTEKTLIIKYKDNYEKDKIFKSISSLKGEIVNDLLNLKYLIVKLPKNYVPEFKRQKFTFYADKLEKVISDKEELLDTSQFQKINQEEYTAPINLINGQNLISDNYKGKGVKIAILDTGIDPLHPDLKDNLNFSKSFVTESNGYTADEDEIDGHGHGTHVAGIAAGNGVASNGKFIGVAPEADIYNLKVVSQYGAATIVATLLAIEEAILKEIDIISLSLGFEASNPDHPLSLALDDAVNNFGIHVTVSAGNSGPEKNTISTPAAARSVISVGAAYSNKSTTGFSSRGLNSDYRYDPDITAPGYQVISTLASSSITDLSEKYFDPTVIISGNNGNYVPFSGTSMSAPVVAGSIALLLSKYPNITPFAMRSALMSSADNTGEEEYVQGSGFINLDKADKQLASSIENQISILPQRSIFPDNPLLFPTEERTVKLQVVSGKDVQLNIDVSNSTLKQYLIFNSTNQSLKQSDAGYYGEFSITFKVPLNPKPGIYEGDIVVTTDIKSYTLNIGPIEVKPPRKQIAWNTWYTDESDSPEGNYFKLSEALKEQNIILKDINRPISEEWLYEYSTLVLPDIESSIPEDKITLLTNFVSNGGTIIVISSFYPFTNIDNLNKLTKQFGQKFNKILDLNQDDYGIRTNLDFITNTSVNFSDTSDWKFNISEPLDWKGGTYVNVFDSGSVIGTINSSTTVIAGFFGNETSKGKLFTFGSEYWFYNNFFKESEEEFSTQLFSLITDKNPFVHIVNGNSSVKLGNTWNSSVYLGNDEFNVTDQYNVLLTYPNDTIVLLNPQIVVGSLGSSISYIPDEVGYYTVTVEYQSLIKSTQFLVYNKSISYNLTTIFDTESSDIPFFLEESDITVIDAGDDVKIVLNTNSSDPLTVKALISFVPELFNSFTDAIQSINTIYTSEISLINSVNSTYYEGTLSTLSSFIPGFYVVELLLEENSVQNFIGHPFSEFYITNPGPLTNVDKSTINGKAISFYDFPEDENKNPEILSLQTGNQLTFSIEEENANFDERNEVFILFIPFYPFLDSGFVIDYWKLIKSNGIFSGTIQLPSNTSLIDNNERTLNFANNNLFTAILIVLKDSNGNYDLNVIISLMKSSLFSSLNLDEGLVFFILVIIPGFVVLIYFIRGRKRRVQMNYDNYNRITRPPPYQVNDQFNPPPPEEVTLQKPVELNFCPYCGSKLSPGENFCMECGRKI